MKGDAPGGAIRELAGVAVVLLIAHVLLALRLGIPYAIPTTLVGAVAAGVALRGPLGRAIARRLEGAPPDQPQPEQLYGELDELRARVAELEERVDFSERLLAQRKE